MGGRKYHAASFALSSNAFSVPPCVACKRMIIAEAAPHATEFFQPAPVQGTARLLGFREYLVVDLYVVHIQAALGSLRQSGADQLSEFALAMANPNGRLFAAHR